MKQHSFSRRRLRGQQGGLHVESLEPRLLLYAQHVHEWISSEAFEFFAQQFGASRLDGSLDRVVAGSFDEDEPGRNPFGNDSLLDHPSNRHFWGHNASFQRTFDDGYSNYDSAPNRAIKYITGGYGYTDVYDSAWDAGAGQGAAALYAAGNFDQAYYFLGHAIHLLQDINLPAHSHNDAHLEGFGAFDDPDPFHDWADGAQFSTSGAGDLPVAAFDEAADADRAANWSLPPGADSSLLRSARDLFAGFTPGAGDVDSEPLYRLFQGSASLADDYDTKDVNGQVDAGARRNGGSSYASWLRSELVEMAEVLIPRAIIETAEAYRYFHGVVDAAAPLVAMPGLSSSDPQAPQFAAQSISLTAAATDQPHGDTGVGKDLMLIEFRQRLGDGTWSNWQEVGGNTTRGHFADGAAYGPDFTGRHGAFASVSFTGQPGVLYSFRTTAEDSAGNRSTSQPAYVQFSGAYVVSGVLHVFGSPANDSIELLSPSAGVVEAMLNGVSLGSFTCSSVTADGLAGDDSIVMRPSRLNRPATFHGGPGADTLIGGYAADVLYGDEGDDFLVGDRGNDTIWGGPGNDRGYGRLGNDVVRGGDGNDQLRGDLGDDQVFGDAGKDRLHGDDGADVVHGGDGGDRLYGYAGRDLLIGGLGVDFAVGGNDDDVLVDGPTSYDANLAALLAIMAEWTSNKSYADRVQNLIDGGGASPALNGQFYISSSTTRDDRRSDMLYGELGQDWFPRNEALDAEIGERTGF